MLVDVATSRPMATRTTNRGPWPAGDTHVICVGVYVIPATFSHRHGSGSPMTVPPSSTGTKLTLSTVTGRKLMPATVTVTPPLVGPAEHTKGPESNFTTAVIALRITPPHQPEGRKRGASETRCGVVRVPIPDGGEIPVIAGDDTSAR